MASVKVAQVLRIIRKAMPALYIALGIENPVVIILSIALILLELIYWDKYDIPLTLINIAIAGLLPFPLGLVLELAILPMFDQALKARRSNPLGIYVSSMATVILTSYLLINPYVALQYAIPLAYLLIASAMSIIKFSLIRLVAFPNRELRTIAGISLDYSLRIILKPPVNAKIIISTPREITIRDYDFKGGELLTNLTASYELGGIYNPEIKLTLWDSRGLIKATRVFKHPQIIVTPRTQWALEIAQDIVAKASTYGIEEVSDIREYTPGDPLRRIHWKKTASLEKLIIKLLSEPHTFSSLVLFTHVANAVKLDKLGSVVVLAMTQAVLSSGTAEVILVRSNGELNNIKVTYSNFTDAVKQVLTNLENINIKTIGGGDYVGYLAPLQDALLSKLNPVLSGLREPIVAGDRDLIGWICARLSNLNCILV